MKTIYTNQAPEPVGPYSQAILAQNYLVCSGQIGLDSASGKLQEGLEAQCLQVMKNIEAVLKASGLGFEDVVKTTCFLSDMGNFSAFNEIYAKYFMSSPARSCVEAKLPKGALVEVEVIAYKK